jgi:uncharacterized protein YpbB
MLKIYIGIIVIGLVSGVVYGAYAYYSSTQARISQLTQNNAKLETAVQSKNVAIKELNNNIEKQIELNSELQNSLSSATEDKEALQNKLRKHDLTNLSKKKPDSIERIINGKTQEILDKFMELTANTSN